MSLVRLENVTKSYDGIPVLDGVGFRVEEGEKIGLIGRNGTGKSTLFRLIMGDTEPESGIIERMRRAKFACLAQLPELKASDTIFDVVMHSFRELLDEERELTRLEEILATGDQSVLARYSTLQEAFQHKGGYEFRLTTKRVLHGLGFTEHEFGLHVNALSGGQRTRLMLALVLLQDADLILLDEPENHLDLDAREWLEGFLKDSTKAFVVISHDRRTLNAVCGRIVEVERGQLRGYTGNYDAYIANKQLVLEQQQKAFERQREMIEKEEKWIDRFRYKNTKATQVQSRIKRLERLELIDAPMSEQKTAGFGFGEVVRSGAVVLEGRDLSMSYGDLCLYGSFSIEVERGERLGIIGPNGCGKTTLLRHLAGVLPGGTGDTVLGHKVRLGFYDQHHQDLNPVSSIFDEMRAARPDWTPEQVRGFMGRFLFTGEDVFKTIGTLSGGELSRVAIAKLIANDANVLLLDEPTNHLDITSREALEAALEAFPGTLVMVSHDRALIDRLVERLVVFENGNAGIHLGNYSDYRYKRDVVEQQVREEKAQDPLRIRHIDKKKRDRQSQGDARKRRRELENLEDQIEAVEEAIADIETQFTNIDPSDYELHRSLNEEYQGLKADLAELYSAWEELASEV